MARFGYATIAGDFDATSGTSTADTLAYYLARVDVPAGVDLVGEVDASKIRRYPVELRPFADAVESVRALSAEGIPLAVVS